MSIKRFDVVAVNLKDKTVRLIATDKDERNADAIINMAVMRRGVDEEFYRGVPVGSHKDGDVLHFDDAEDDLPEGARDAQHEGMEDARGE